MFDASGNLYGTTRGGGNAGGFGTVYEIPKGTTAIKPLASFDKANGAHPYGDLTIDSNGNLYGTTWEGGASGVGTVFEIVHGTSAITTFATFNFTNGADPQAGLTFDSTGNLFGTTIGGGANGYGTVFEIPHGTTTITTLASFNKKNGQYPCSAPVIDSGGNLFGMTHQGGANDYGCVFEILSGSNDITVLGSFNGPGNGLYPLGNLAIDPQGNVFGIAPGGTGGYGTIFEVAHGGSGMTPLANLSSANGYNPEAGLTIDSSGNLFGTNSTGGASGYGTVFEVAHGTNVITTYASFNKSDGASPYAGVTIDAAGNVFGTAHSGGVSNNGTVYEIFHGTHTIVPLVSFPGAVGGTPNAAPIVDSVGNLYGTNSMGGPEGYGEVYEVAHGTTAIIPLVSFNLTTGIRPYGAMVMDSDGNLFGTTDEYGSGGTTDVDGIAGSGEVFEIARGSNAITTIASFDYYNGGSPDASLTIDASGDLFGTTSFGGTDGDGTVFEIARGTGVITTLANFNIANGAHPKSCVVLDVNGNIYGTTQNGGSGGYGTVFEISADTQTLTTLVNFSNANGSNPSGPLATDASGNLFGTTVSGGTGGGGTVFEIPHGTTTLNTLANLTYASGSVPNSGLIIDSGGNLFGTTAAGGAGGFGTVFEIAHGTSNIQTLANFNFTNGASPADGVRLDSSGNLYGTTAVGGPGGYGTVFELSPTAPTLYFTMPPASATTGNALNSGTGVQVSVVYPWGNVYTGDTSTVTLTLAAGSFANGSTSVSAPTINGVATFANLVINSPGSYTITASDSALPSTALRSFVVIPAGIIVTGSSSDDSMYLSKDADGVHLDEWLNSPTPGYDAPTARFLLTGSSSILIDCDGGNDKVTIDQGNGDLLEAVNGITNAGGSVNVTIIGTDSDDNLALDGDTRTISWNVGAAAKVIYFDSLASLEYRDTGGLDTISVAGPIPLTFDTGPTADVLNVAANSNATVNFGASDGNLTINGNGNTLLVFGSGNPTFQFVTAPINPPTGGEITGVVFNDSNADGKREGAEKALAGRELFIDSNHNGKLDSGELTAITDPKGRYHFELPEGAYRVREVLPDGFRESSPACGYFDLKVTSGQISGGASFGQTRLAKITGVLFLDVNRDGVREAGESALAGWIVYLDANNNGKLDPGEASFQTSSDGRYTFGVPAGKYVVREVVKNGYKRTSLAAGAHVVSLVAGRVASGENFGDHKV